MANKNFNKQVAPARKKLAEGGMGLMGPRIKREPVPRNKKRMPRRPVPIEGADRRPMPKLPGKPGKPGPSRPMPKLPKTPRPNPLTPEQLKRLKELMQKRKKGSVTNKALKASDPKMQNMQNMQKRKKLMGGGSSSSREAMMHGFYNKDMGMGKKKK